MFALPRQGVQRGAIREVRTSLQSKCGSCDPGRQERLGVHRYVQQLFADVVDIELMACCYCCYLTLETCSHYNDRKVALLSVDG